MKVLKFGGSSLGNREAISKVISILLNRIENKEKIIVVVSAFSGITDQLIGLSRSNQSKRSQKALQSIKNRHIDVIKFFFNNSEQQDVLQQFDNLYQELTKALQFNLQKQDELKRNQDHIIGFGERFSAQIITSLLKKNNVNTLYTDTRTLIKTNDNYGFAKIRKSISYKNISDYYHIHTDKVIVATGFIASTINGHSTTLGRGGSDYTASVIGAATSAEAVEIWTDVDGLMTADPEKVPSAITIDQISYKNAEGFSKYGAKVIYPPTIKPAMKYDIPIYIKNTFRPGLNGTLIHNRSINSTNSIYGIVTIPNVTLLTMKCRSAESVGNFLPKRFTNRNQEIKIVEHSIDNNLIKIAIINQNISESALKIEHTIQEEFNGQIDKFELFEGLSMITIIGRHASILSVKSLIARKLTLYDKAVRSMIYNKKLKTLSIFTESKFENQLLNDLHNMLITEENVANS